MQKHDASTADYKTAPMAQFVKKLKFTGLIGYLGLVIYLPILILFFDPSTLSLPYITLTLFWLPLLFAIKGLLEGNPYTYAWSNFVIMWCFLHALTAIWTFEGHKGLIVIEIALLTLAFIGNTYFARYRGREMGLALPKIKELKEKEKAMFEHSDQTEQSEQTSDKS